MFDRIYFILVSFLGESKQGYYSSTCTQYQFNCPRCAEENDGEPDGKYNLEVNLQKMVYKCWSCCDTDNMSGKLKTLIKKYGGYSLYEEFKEEVKSIMATRMYDIDLFNDDKESLSKALDDDSYVRLPVSFRKIDIAALRDPLLIKYINKRHLSQEVINRFNIGYTDNKDPVPSVRNRIVVPNYDMFGDLTYWVARDFTGSDKRIKYKNCDAEKNEVLFNESLIDWDAPIYLVEGLFDSLDRLPNTIPLLGKILINGSATMDKIISHANSDVIVSLDGDTKLKETINIYKKLDTGRLRGHVKYIRLGTESIPWKDFSDAYEAGGYRAMAKIARSARSFTEQDLIFE